LLDASARMEIKVGDRVKGGASVLAYLRGDQPATTAAVGAGTARQGAL
jgi:hypothetical protein